MHELFGSALFSSNNDRDERGKFGIAISYFHVRQYILLCRSNNSTIETWYKDCTYISWIMPHQDLSLHFRMNIYIMELVNVWLLICFRVALRSYYKTNLVHIMWVLPLNTFPYSIPYILYCALRAIDCSRKKVNFPRISSFVNDKITFGAICRCNVPL